MKLVIKFFDKLEDFARTRLSSHPIPYAILGGIFVVLFWRGVWETADLLHRSGIPFFGWFFDPFLQVLLSIGALMLTGLMVSVFIGDRIILSGLRHEKKIEETTKKLAEEEVITLKHIRDEVRALKKELEDIKRKN